MPFSSPPLARHCLCSAACAVAGFGAGKEEGGLGGDACVSVVASTEFLFKTWDELGALEVSSSHVFADLFTFERQLLLTFESRAPAFEVFKELD